jgi:hypothetical protein
LNLNEQIFEPKQSVAFHTIAGNRAYFSRKNALRKCKRGAKISLRTRAAVDRPDRVKKSARARGSPLVAPAQLEMKNRVSRQHEL